MSPSDTAKLWQERLRRFASSQMTVAQFCLSEGVSQPSYYKWRKRLREQPSGAKPQKSARTADFMPLRLANGASIEAPETEEQVSAPLTSTTIELPGGIRIRVEVPAGRQFGQPAEAQA